MARSTSSKSDSKLAGRNRLLATMPAEQLRLLTPSLEAVPLAMHEYLEEPHKPVPAVYFILSGIASIIAGNADDRRIEVGLIGCEGMTGLSVVLGGNRSPNATLVQASGSALRMPSAKLREALSASPALHGHLLRFAQAFMAQTTQTAIANGRAKVEKRLARWLLMAHDRLRSDELPLTHQFLSVMLGVRRSGVTVALHELEGRGLIRSLRGTVVVRNRAGLKDMAAGYYGVAEAELERLVKRPS